jgi:hypothetical protein
MYAIWVFGGGERQEQRIRKWVMAFGMGNGGEGDGERKSG